MSLLEDFKLRLPEFKIEELDDCFQFFTLSISKEKELGIQIQKAPILASELPTIIRIVKEAFANWEREHSKKAQS